MKAEREHYFDAGVEQRFNGGLKLALDAYYKMKRNLLDEGQFGSALVLSPFNYAKGYAWGVELSGNYTHGPIDLYANVARGQEKGKDIVSASISSRPTSSPTSTTTTSSPTTRRNWTGSGGGSYTIHDGLGTLVPTVDFVYGAGLRDRRSERDRAERRRAAVLLGVQRRHLAELRRPGRAQGPDASAPTCSTSSTRNTRSAAAPASASARRNGASGAASSSA